MKIFAIDTSTDTLVIAYSNEQNILTLNYRGVEKHASKIGPLVHEFLNMADVNKGSIDLFGCGVGPGSLTGLRIGIAFIQGMAHAFSKNVVAVTSSEVVAANFLYHQGEIVIVKKAREGYVYIACYKENTEMLKPSVMEFEKAKHFVQTLNNPVVVGDAKKLFEHIAQTAPDELEAIRGEVLLNKVFEKIKSKSILKPHELEPLYLQKSIAEMNFEKRKSKG